MAASRRKVAPASSRFFFQREPPHEGAVDGEFDVIHGVLLCFLYLGDSSDWQLERERALRDESVGFRSPKGKPHAAEDYEIPVIDFARSELAVIGVIGGEYQPVDIQLP